MISGNYGAFFRNDGANTYFLLTAAGDQYGQWNALRPLYINDVSGAVTIGTSLTFPDGTTPTTATGNQNQLSTNSTNQTVSGNTIVNVTGLSAALIAGKTYSFE